eukprot:XP_002594946.1 hypothetical protein BRAFLDRAFT_103718 [Branchiostoma floridae]
MRSGSDVAAESETKPESRESLNGPGACAPTGEAPQTSVAGKSASPADVVGRPAPANLPRPSSSVPTPAPSADGRDGQGSADKSGARKKVTFAPSTDDLDAQPSADKSGAKKKVTFAPSTDGQDAQRQNNKSGARKKETFGGMKSGFLSGGTAGGTKLKAKEAQKVGKMRRGGRKSRESAKSREAAKSREKKKSYEKKAAEQARLEQEAAQRYEAYAMASMLTTWPNVRIGTGVSAAGYPLTPNLVFRAPVDAPEQTG